MRQNNEESLILLNELKDIPVHAEENPVMVNHEDHHQNQQIEMFETSV